MKKFFQRQRGKKSAFVDYMKINQKEINNTPIETLSRKLISKKEKKERKLQLKQYLKIKNLSD